MHVGEYILALVIIVLGLAIADLAISTHRLIRRRADVKFDAAPILAALIASYLVFLNFWGDYSHFRTVTSAGLWSTLPNLAILFVNFLIAAAALPDEWKGNLDLWTAKGKENLLRNVPEEWAAGIAGMTGAGFIDPGVDAAKLYTNDIWDAASTG